MKRLLKADIYRVLKSRLTLIALILVLAFPVLIVFLYVGIRAMSGLSSDMEGMDVLFNANSIIGSAYSLTNNIGLVLPAFAGILVCMDISNGTLRNKIIAGNRRAEIYLSHLIVSILFSVIMITIYAAMTAGLALLFFPFNTDPSMDLGREILYFIATGTMSFVFIATVSTLLAMTLRSVAPTIIFTIVLSIALMAINSVILLIDYQPYRYAVYLIPSFTGNFFNLNSFSLTGLITQGEETSRGLMFAEGMLSYLFFGIVNTVLGLLLFKKRDIN
ncbi:MAG: hypothetical protein IJL62_06655 [Clostridia bacterium]|nr:hypothetical protein [Clostridia bacterium]